METGAHRTIDEPDIGVANHCLVLCPPFVPSFCALLCPPKIVEGTKVEMGVFQNDSAVVQSVPDIPFGL